MNESALAEAAIVAAARVKRAADLTMVVCRDERRGEKWKLILGWLVRLGDAIFFAAGASDVCSTCARCRNA